jgi:hypothetical protein
MNIDPGSTQILTWHCSAQSQIISQLKSSGTTQISPSGLSKHLRTGSVHTPHYILTNWMEPWAFIKPSAHNQALHMELSLRSSFYLRCNLEGYTVSTTVGFPIKIIEALAP